MNFVDYLKEDKWEAKKKYAERHASEQSEIGMENGMTEEQTDAITKLCEYRHFIHTHQEELFNDESSDYSEMNSLLTSEIYDLLEPCNFDVDFDIDTFLYDTKDLMNDTTCYEFELTKEEREEELRKCIEFANNVNNDIEIFLGKIDKRYNTHFAPTGKSRY